MCGSCGASGPIASYIENDVVQISWPEEGIPEPRYAKVLEVREDWGLQIKFSDSSVKWISWDPFICVKTYPDFSIGLVSPDKFVEKAGAKDLSSDDGIYVTIGQGWLKQPCVLPQKIVQL
mmetsp:Transcript_25062/g.28885  ORF Transcript_25062/g.28885 Transcript_25062/m.28885 type:complete len:120 (-) Transcript_25062:488-847(-)